MISILKNGDIFELKDIFKEFVGCHSVKWNSTPLNYSGEFRDSLNDDGFISKLYNIKQAIDWVNQNCILQNNRQELSYQERITWFINNYYEYGMEYNILLKNMENENLDNFKWYDDYIKFPKYKDELKNNNHEK